MANLPRMAFIKKLNKVITHLCLLRAKSLQSYLALCEPMDCTPPGSSLCPWDFPGKNTRAGCHFLLQGIFLTQRLNLCLQHLQTISEKNVVCAELGSRKANLTID